MTKATAAPTPSYGSLFKKGKASLSFAILCSVSLVALDILIVNTVLPTILRDLGGIQFYAWAIGAYSLGNFLTIPIFSVFMGKIGGRTSFSLAILLFLVGAVVAALAPAMPWVVLGRFFQGLGAGGFFAIPFGIISRFYEPELQPRAVGLVSSVWGAAAVGGPLAGAALLELAGWRWVFWFNIPVGILILVLGLFALRKEGPPPEPHAIVNWVGPLLFAASTALLLEGLSHSLPLNAILLPLTFLIFWLFYRHEKKHPSPVIPPDAWRLSKFLGVAFLGIALTACSFGGAETFLPLLLQGIYRATPLEAGLILTFGSLGWSFTSVFIARFAENPRRLGQTGSFTLAFGLAMVFFALFSQSSIFWIYLGWLIAGIGMGQVVPTYNTLAIDQSARYPGGVATGAFLLALTWGFAVGAPAAGVAAHYGFADGLNLRTLGVETLSETSLMALREGGVYALATCLGLAALSILIARKMPRRRSHSS